MSRVAGHIRGNVVAYVAVFLALCSGAYAMSNVAPRNSVVSRSIKNGQVKAKDLARNSVRSSSVRNGSLAGADLATGAVGSAQVADGALTGADVHADSLTGAQINEGSLGSVPNAAHSTSADSAAQALFADQAIGTVESPLATVGPFTISGACENAGGEPKVGLFANGPPGSQMAASFTSDTDDNASFIPGASQKSIDGDTSMFGILGSSGHFRRLAGTAFLSTSSGTIVEVDFNLVANTPITFGCSFRGAAALGA